MKTRFLVPLTLAAGFATAAGCGQAQDTSGLGGQGGEKVARAEQAASSTTVCVSIRRAGSAGNVADAQIVNSSPPRTFGSNATMNAGTFSGAERQSLLRFDLSAVPSGPSIDIASATLTLYKGTVTPTGPGTVEIHRALVPWEEAAVTWQSFGGAFDPIAAASFTNTTTPVYTADVRALVTAWVHGDVPNHGLVLTEPVNATNFWTSEYTVLSQRPTLDVCYSVGCAAGTADCNGDARDGCEVDLGTSVGNCGACGNACSLPHATAMCDGRFCDIAACDVGYADCDHERFTGCERMITTNSDCGGCGVVCDIPFATASCDSGTCTLVACHPGFVDCDGVPENGCEPGPCGDGGHCSSGSDCVSGVCQGGFCHPPECNDGALNGTETGVDCGGDCPPCAPGQPCGVDTDCASQVCNGVCQPPSCTDGAHNGNETGYDCGGDCPECPDGDGCLVNGDCASGICTAGFCEAPTCFDGVKNGGETGVDCGGPDCGTCSSQRPCESPFDCVDRVCLNGLCQIASCGDGVKNGAELGIDCGGNCQPCPSGTPCATGADCDSQVCQLGVCMPPSCSDGVRNGDETQVDCGGSCFRAEVCNGLDDDCNGLVDEGLGSTTCGLGACQVTVASCVGGVPQQCQPLAPQTEVCDGLLDDDCDGVVDNGCACTNGDVQPCYTGAPSTLGVGACAAGVQTCAHGQWGACVGEVTPQRETCDNTDEDCNGLVDDDLGQITCGLGSCQVTVPICVAGQRQTCTPLAPTPEVCDGLDNDCDGDIDNMGTISCGVGACARTVSACLHDAPNTCTPGTPTAEICDGIDNDCDGVIDNGDPGTGAPCHTGKLGSCGAGVGMCIDGAIACTQLVQPSPEVCDGRDNDCNGHVDDDTLGSGEACDTGKLGVCANGLTGCSGGTFVCHQTQFISAEVCDGIDNDCDGVIDNNAALACPAVANGSAACNAGACEIGSCNGLFLDCNGLASDGCEVDGAADNHNCGSCGFVCPSGTTCSSGSCVSTLPASCRIANGVTWCYNPGACGQACNAVCASVGLTPADPTVTFLAQNTAAKCLTIAQSFGLASTNFGAWTNGCLEDSPGVHTVGGGLIGPLLCSFSSNCPTRHLTQMDGLNVACGAGSRRSVCACQ